MATPVAAVLGHALGRSAPAQEKHEMPVPKASVPGAAVSGHSHLLDTAADALQVKRPLDAMSEFLNGIEYIVSARLFTMLPDEEKRLWHSHHYELKSGELLAPGVPELAGHALMRDLVTTYGKTWQVDRYPDFPTGIPQLMMGFVADGQVDPHRLQERDRRLGTSTQAIRQDRGDIPLPKVDPGANTWQSGRTVQRTLREVPVRGRRGLPAGQ